MTAGLRQGSLTRAWGLDVAVVGSVKLTNGPTTSGAVIATVSGSGYGAQGVSARGCIGRGVSSQVDLYDGTSREASDWTTDTAVRCKLDAGVGGRSRRGRGVPVVVSAGLQQGSMTEAEPMEMRKLLLTVGQLELGLPVGYIQTIDPPCKHDGWTHIQGKRVWSRLQCALQHHAASVTRFTLHQKSLEKRLMMRQLRRTREAGTYTQVTTNQST